MFIKHMRMQKRRENGDVHASRETWMTRSMRVLGVSRDTLISPALLFFGRNYSLLAAHQHNYGVCLRCLSWNVIVCDFVHCVCLSFGTEYKDLLLNYEPTLCGILLCSSKTER